MVGFRWSEQHFELPTPPNQRDVFAMTTICTAASLHTNDNDDSGLERLVRESLQHRAVRHPFLSRFANCDLPDIVEWVRYLIIIMSLIKLHVICKYLSNGIKTKKLPENLLYSV